MKSRPLPIIEKLPQSNLYLDDVKYLYELISEISEAKDVSIKIKTKDTEYELETLDDIMKIESFPVNDFNYIKISCLKPYMVIDLTNYNAEVFISKDTPVLRGTMEKVKSRIKMRSRKLSWLISNPFLPAIPFIIALNYIKDGQYINGGIIIGLCLILYLLGLYLNFYKYSIIHTKFKKNLPSFFERNKDKIILAIFLIPITALITVVIQNLLAN